MNKTKQLEEDLKNTQKLLVDYTGFYHGAMKGWRRTLDEWRRSNLMWFLLCMLMNIAFLLSILIK